MQDEVSTYFTSKGTIIVQLEGRSELKQILFKLNQVNLQTKSS